jgi:hypothetical protein
LSAGCATKAPEPALRPTFLLGRFSYPYSRPGLPARLRPLGYDVVPQLGPGVQVVIVGDDAVNQAGDGFDSVKDSAEYREAQRLGIEMIPLRLLRSQLDAPR